MEVEKINFNAGEEMNFLQETYTNSLPDNDVLNPQDIHNLRLNTCMSCEFVTEDRHCTECGCPVVMMAQFNFKTCPKGKW